MSRTSRADLAGLTTVRTVGALVPADLLGRIISGTDLPGLSADDYRLELGVSPREAANRAWSVLTGAWTAYRDALATRPEGDRATGLTRDKWLAVVLRELGFGRVLATPAGGIHADDRSFPVSHLWGDVPIHLLGWGVDLDRKTPGVAGAAERAPYAMVQELLNRSHDHLWALLANGGTLRLLRDSSSLVGQSYVEFDLQAMFDGEVFSDFAVLYLLCHQTRFEPVDSEAGPEDCWLERWRTDAVETGARALGALRIGVQRAIEALGTGFLQHPANAELRERIEGDLNAVDYRRALLRLVYRLLFCFVAEDRSLLLDPAADVVVRERYADWFSTRRLRRIATRRRGTRHADLWQALSIVLDGLGREGGRPEIGLPGIGGLFEHGPDDVVTGAQLCNEALLAALRHLCVIQPAGGGPKRTVDYRNLGAEELGGIYEGLLEYVPRVDLSERIFTLELLSGNERKTTGAHYTPAPIIDCLLESALEPLLQRAEASADPEDALLALTVCDPACGSGHFLVAAARRIARTLARVRSDGAEPSIGAAQAALRDIIGTCIYGIDINPMAVELCKVSLWLEAVEPGKPLSFLDHHIVAGNGLIGATPRLLDGGVPDAAFTWIEGDDKPVVTTRRKANGFQRRNRDQQMLQLSYDTASLAAPVAAESAAINALPSDHLTQIAEKARRFEALAAAESTTRARLAADAWCAAILAVKRGESAPITDETVRTAAQDPKGLTAAQRSVIEELTTEHGILHWHLAFPHVFPVDLDAGTATGCAGGFDLIIGNPPWDTLSPDAKEFFAGFEPSIRFVDKAEQQRIIDELSQSAELAAAWQQHRRALFALVHFLKNSGRYHMFAQGNLGKGDFNIYRMFVELALTMTNGEGWAAQVTPSGLYNGANAAGIRSELLDRCRLQLVGGLINKGGHWFPGIDATTRFAIYSSQRGGTTTAFDAGFQITTDQELHDLRTRPIRITADTVRTQSPAALAINETRPGPDADIAAKIYAAHPAFGTVVPAQPTRRYQREIDMGTDRDLFNDTEPGLPLYEGRMVDQYDHRAKAYRSGRGRAAVWEPLPFGDPRKDILPQWRVPSRNIPVKLGDRTERYRVAFCDVTAPRNERSLIAALIPPGVVCGHSVPTFTFDEADWQYLAFLAVANSFPADFLIRKKVTLHVSLSILDALPFPRLSTEDPLLSTIAPLVLGLTCTSADLTPYWNAMSKYGWCESVPTDEVPPCALIDPAERREAEAELDGIVAKHVYGLDRDELAFILDQFPVLQRRDEQEFGDFATKSRVLSWYDRL